MEEFCKKPSIRFSGFTDDWEQRKLKNVVSFSKGKWYSKADINEEGTPIILYGSLYTDYKYNIDDVKTFAIQKDNSVISKGSEVIIPSSGETSEDIARASAVTQENVILAGDLNVLEPNKEIDNIFLAMNLSNGNSKRQLIKRAQGKSVVHLYNSDIESVKLLIPTKEEQNHITEFILGFDNTITLHQRKLKKLESIKTTFLSKMFVSGDDRVPEYRFKGFTDDWEHRKLIESASVIGGNAWKSQDYTVNGEYLVVTISNVTGGEYIDDTRGNRINTENPGKFLLSKNDILVSLTGNVGRVSKATGCLAVLNQRVGKIKNNSSMDSVFLYYVLSNDTFENNMINAGQGAAQLNISNNDILNYSFASTLNYFEQNKIGILFENLDKTITLNRNKIEQLELLKKYLLKNMFV